MKSHFRWRISPLFTLITFCYLFALDKQPLPIVLVHGIMSDDHAMKPTEKYIQKYLPNTYVKSVKLGAGMLTSFCNMRQQVEWLRKEIQKDPHLKNGFNIIAHSQGGLVARAFIQQYNEPQVHNFISWGSPQNGIYGLPGNYDNKFFWLNHLTSHMHTFLYSPLFQKYVSFSNYWKDPFNSVLYLTECNFLPYINNEIVHTCNKIYKDNLCSIDSMVLVKSLQEDIVDPADSCHFGCYKNNCRTEVIDMFHSDLYIQDRIGLKTLYESGRLHLKTANCTHANFQEDEKNFVENTLQFLRIST